MLVWSHSSQQSSSALHSRENAPTTGTPGQPRRTHADPGLADSVRRQSGLAGDTHRGWREAQAQAVPQGRCAAGPSAPAAGRRECTEISPGEALNRYRNLSPRWAYCTETWNHTAQQAPFFLLGTIGNGSSSYESTVTTTNHVPQGVSPPDSLTAPPGQKQPLN